MKNSLKSVLVIAALSLTAALSANAAEIVQSKVAKTDSALDRLCYVASEGPSVVFNAEAQRYGVDARKLKKEDPTCRKYGVRLSQVPKNYEKRQRG